MSDERLRREERIHQPGTSPGRRPEIDEQITRLFAEPLPARLEWEEGEIVALRVARMRLVVVELVRRWRVDGEWWRVSGTSDGAGHARDYVTVRTADGHVLDLYGDRRTGEWFVQRLLD